MTYTTRQLRRGMDVFDAAGAYLGTVAWVRTAREVDHPAPRAPQAPTEIAAGPFSGEALGPMPTESVGNLAPRRQNQATLYASFAPRALGDHSPRVTEIVVVRLLVALDWATLRPRVRRIPVSLVQTASLERIVLTVGASALP